MLAIMKGDYELVSVLVKANANIDLQDKVRSPDKDA